MSAPAAERTMTARQEVRTSRKILLITSSSRQGSTTERLGRLMAGAVRASGLDADLVNVGELGLPWCTGTAEQASDEAVQQWRRRVAEAVAYVWVSAEWHGSMTGTLKNSLDLLAERDLRWKVVALVAQAGGALGASNALAHMRTVAQNLGAWVLPVELSVTSEEVRGTLNPSSAERVTRIARELGDAVSKLDRYL